jgi:hypothetical protein
MLELKLNREILTPICTIGTLNISGLIYTARTLEDMVRPPGIKVYGKTAIPEGLYRIKFQWSNHFQKEMPYLQDVPNFSGVMIHNGTNPDHTLGCVLVGKSAIQIDGDKWELRESKKAFAELYNILQSRKGDEIIVEVRNPITVTEELYTENLI